MSLFSPECEELLVAGYVLGNLSPAEAALFEELLSDNPELTQQIAELQQTLTLAYEFPQVSPPEGLRAKVLAAAAETKIAVTQTDRNSESALNIAPLLAAKFPWGKMLGAIAASAILGLGIANYRLWKTLQTAAVEAPAFRQLVYSLQGTEEAEGAVVKLSVNPDRLEGKLDITNLSPLPPDRVYVLWTVVGDDAPFTTDEKGAILTEVFQVNADGTLFKDIIVPKIYRNSQAIQKVAVTIENRSAPQAHQGSILLVTEQSPDKI